MCFQREKKETAHYLECFEDEWLAILKFIQKFWYLANFT